MFGEIPYGILRCEAEMLGVIRELCWALDESSRQGDWSLNEVTEGLGVD